MLLQLNEGLKLMILGMSGVFIVTGIVYISMKALCNIDRKESNKDNN